MTEYIAYHGTNEKNINSIKEHGFIPSTEHNEWLGFGVYFFIEGAFDPVTNARNWAISNAWDNKLLKYRYTNYTVLMTIVAGARVLDLRTEEDLGIFEKLRTHIMDKYEAEKNKFQRRIHPDTFLCNAVSKSLRLDILIGNFYIKTKQQRVNYHHSRVPNSTVLCAKENAIIEIEHIDIIETKGVPHE